MTGDITIGLVAALGGAVLYGASPVAQAVAARRTAVSGGLGVRLTLHAARQSIWLVGLAGDVGGFLLETLAFSKAPTTVVAPVMACDILVFVLLAWPVFHARPSGHTVAGAAALGLGIGVLALAFGGEAGLGAPADDAELIAFLCADIACAGVAAVGATRALAAGHATLAAGWCSVAAGVSYAFATIATRQVGRTFSLDHPWQLLATPTPYVLIVCSILGITMMQRGLQASPILTFPVTSALSAFLPVVLGAALLGDEVPEGWAEAGFVASLVLLAVGVALVGRGRVGAQAALDVGDSR